MACVVGSGRKGSREGGLASDWVSKDEYPLVSLRPPPSVKSLLFPRSGRGRMSGRLRLLVADLVSAMPPCFIARPASRIGTEKLCVPKSRPSSSCSLGDVGKPSDRRASADSGGAALPADMAVLPLRLPRLPAEPVEGYMTLRIGK